MEGIRAVGFDLDGTFMRTCVDYAKLDGADLQVCLGHGIPFDEIDFGDGPKRLRHPIRLWLEANGRGDEYSAVSKAIDRAFTDCETEFVDEAVLFPGSAEALDELKFMGYRVGILTRGSLEYATLALGPLFDRFDAVVGRDHSDYDNAKPSPAAMREFAAELGVEPEEILYVGDNITDWHSARDAGARFVGVRTGSGSDGLWHDADPFIPVIDCAGDVVNLFRRRQRVLKNRWRRGYVDVPVLIRSNGFVVNGLLCHTITRFRRPACGRGPAPSCARGRRT